MLRHGSRVGRLRRVRKLVGSVGLVEFMGLDWTCITIMSCSGVRCSLCSDHASETQGKGWRAAWGKIGLTSVLGLTWRINRGNVGVNFDENRAKREVKKGG
jgi:hypothetical protein